jgi:hypothetical protein
MNVSLIPPNKEKFDGTRSGENRELRNRSEMVEGAESPVPGFISSCDLRISLRRDIFKDNLYGLQCIAAIDFSIPQIPL